jgi:hypothetical protein
MSGATLEAACYAMTGPHLGACLLLKPWASVNDLAYALDAPERIARGSVKAGHQMADGSQYMTASATCFQRAYGFNGGAA